MRALRIIHAADCHLDAPSRSLERGVRERVEQSARTALERLVALAVDREADALVLAGDLFDRDLLRIPTELWLPEVLGEATEAGVTVIAVTGNHDPGGGSGPLDRIPWPTARFHLVRDRRVRPIELRRRDGALAGIVMAAGHESPREADNLVATFPAVAADVPVVGLVHCQVLELEPPRLMRFSWRGGNLDTVVSWSLVPEGTGTRLLITHDGFDETDPAQRMVMGILGGGWRGHLIRQLATLLSGDQA